MGNNISSRVAQLGAILGDSLSLDCIAGAMTPVPQRRHKDLVQAA